MLDRRRRDRARSCASRRRMPELDALVEGLRRDRRRARRPRCRGRCRRGRARRPRRPADLRAEPPGVRDAPLRADARAPRPVAPSSSTTTRTSPRSRELTYGAAAGARVALIVTLGTGIGGGMILDGRIYRGANGFGAEFGHFTVERERPDLRVRRARALGGDRDGQRARPHGARARRSRRGRRRSSRPRAATSPRSAASTWRPRRPRATPTRRRCSRTTPTTSRSGSRTSRTSSTPNAS